VGRIWLGRDRSNPTAAIASFRAGFVWHSPTEGADHEAVARFRDGYVWRGNAERLPYHAQARYREGSIWLGPHEGLVHNADARYRDGSVWLGHADRSESDADGRFDESEEDAAAAACVALLGLGVFVDEGDGSIPPYDRSTGRASGASVASANSQPVAAYSLLVIGIASMLAWFSLGRTSDPTQSAADAASTSGVAVSAVRAPAPPRGTPGAWAPIVRVTKAQRIDGIETPVEVIEVHECPYESCRYGERLLAKEEMITYADHPESLATAPSALRRSAVIKPGEWVTSVTAVSLARRHLAKVPASGASYGNESLKGPRLQPGLRVSVFGSAGEGCYTSWIDSQFYLICGLELTSDYPAGEYWTKIRTRSAGEVWVRSEGKFTTQEGMNSELGAVIAAEDRTTEQKLEQIDRLIAAGGDLNGRSTRHGISATEALGSLTDVELLNQLVTRGLDLSKECPAESFRYGALKPGGPALLGTLLAKGMRLECLSEPAFSAFLTFGIGLDSYSVERAIEVAQILQTNGARVNEVNRDGKTILSIVNDPKYAERLAALRAALISMGAR